MDDSYLDQWTVDLTVRSAQEDDSKLATEDLKITENISSPRSAMLINDMSDH